MKTPLSLPRFITLIFGLSLVSLSTYISFLFQPGFEHSRYHLALIIELSDQRLDDEEEWYFSSLHKHEPIGWITLSSPPSSQRQLELQQREQPVEYAVQHSHRRQLVRQWFMIAMTATTLPLSAYMMLKVDHRLGGWKEANIQYRAIVEHQRFKPNDT
ncbi:hypothetical protein [Photobacterium lutimaris]|uniref:Uncharacterized protein n=1 Tax=Photobacterium lutimaris TaxID=388278 RepID=A0A2T3J436_9GAMM|nr:hypothetical protein [Photobacterium lutimaris]PSU36016.1 hypothetical protein C9I99_03105 [Photobacterium lutimaris]TDR79108.1 hypothetical protein DFP78_101623 [Photobacterium lutimaris]